MPSSRSPRSRWKAWFFAGLALAAALACNYLAGRYVDSLPLPAPGEDLLLSWLPPLPLGPVFIWGFAAFLGLAFASAWLHERGRLPWLLWCFAVLIAVRSGFLVLTPLHAPMGHAPVDGFLYEHLGRYLTFRNDLFFSAHTALPFLAYLLFRRTWVRAAFLGFSVALAATVLLAHMHYTVDVAGAYFITYAVYRMTRRWSPAPLRAASC